MALATFSRRCTQVGHNNLECDVVANRIYIGVYIGSDGYPNDIEITPTAARELAEWLEQAALEAEQADE